MHPHLSWRQRIAGTSNWFRQPASPCPVPSRREISLVWRAYSLTRFPFLARRLTLAKAVTRRSGASGGSIANDLRKTGGKNSPRGGWEVGRRGKVEHTKRSMTYLGFFKLIEGLPLLLATQALFLLIQREIRARLREVRVRRALERRTKWSQSRPEAVAINPSKPLCLAASPHYWQTNIQSFA